MCVLEPNFEEVLTAPEPWIEYTKFNMVRLSRIKISHDVIVLCLRPCTVKQGRQKQFNVKLASVNTSVVPTEAQVALLVLLVTQRNAVDLHGFGVGYWSKTRDGSLSQRQLLSRSTVNYTVGNYAVSPSAADDDVLASHCTCLAILLQKPGATIK